MQRDVEMKHAEVLFGFLLFSQCHKEQVIIKESEKEKVVLGVSREKE